MNILNRKQTGVALIISLIMLVLMTIIGLAAIRVSLMEEKMAANSRDQALAFQAGEIALRDGESWLMSRVVEPIPTNDGNNRVWNPDGNQLDATNNQLNWWQERNLAWWVANGQSYGQNIPNVNAAPRTIIEYHEYITDDLVLGDGNVESGRVFYRITARSTGGSDQARILLQSTVAKRY